MISQNKSKSASKKAVTIFIPVRYAEKIVVPSNIINRLPNKIMIFGSVQFLEQLSYIAKQLESAGKTVLMIKSKNFLYDGMISEKGQLLGCNAECFDDDISKNHDEGFDAFFYVGDGVFHPKALLVNNRKDIYCYDPKIGKLEVLRKELHDDIQKRRKGSVLKFLSSNNIGVIITTKIGQCNSKRADSVVARIYKKWPDKNIYTFICDELNFQELENFNFIDIYINTACPRIGYEDTVRSPKPIINIEDVEGLLR